MADSGTAPLESLAVLAASDEAITSKVLGKLTGAEAALLRYEWRFWARPNQLAPAGEWGIWLLMTGRGFGKTRAGAQWVIEQAQHPGHRIAIVGRIPADCRDVLVNGESGILLRDGDAGAAGCCLQVTDVTKPLRSVALIADQDKEILFTGDEAVVVKKGGFSR